MTKLTKRKNEKVIIVIFSYLKKQTYVSNISIKNKIKVCLLLAKKNHKTTFK